MQTLFISSLVKLDSIDVSANTIFPSAGEIIPSVFGKIRSGSLKKYRTTRNKKKRISEIIDKPKNAVPSQQIKKEVRIGRYPSFATDQL